MDIIVAKDILKANDQLARANQARLGAAGVMAVNIMGSPGCGKTTLLERLAQDLRDTLRFGVIEGDLATAQDAERLEHVGIRTAQINTGGGCHLDANMVASALDSLDLNAFDLLFIENVGNLVCPSSYRLGERRRMVLLSIPEGDDKVAKYPPMFTGVDVVVLTKTDLLPHVDFDTARIERELRVLSPGARIIHVCAKSGDGMAELVDWLRKQRTDVSEKLARVSQAT